MLNKKQKRNIDYFQIDFCNWCNQRILTLFWVKKLHFLLETKQLYITYIFLNNTKDCYKKLIF